jgi:hypothetical protein
MQNARSMDVKANTEHMDIVESTTVRSVCSVGLRRNVNIVHVIVPFVDVPGCITPMENVGRISRNRCRRDMLKPSLETI